jgi:two-component system chemotaxis response regulator CheB
MDKMRIEPGNVYLAPAGYHLLIEGEHCALSTEAPVLYARPSIDVLFETASQALGGGVVAVVLSGTGSDGAEGAAAVQRAGGLVLIESPATAREGQMPHGAVDATQNARQLPAEQLGPYLAALAKS